MEMTDLGKDHRSLYPINSNSNAQTIGVAERMLFGAEAAIFFATILILWTTSRF